MTQRLRTGVKKYASFDQNLASARKAVADYGPVRVISRLEEMKGLFYWIKNDPDQIERIENLIKQLEYDSFILPNLIEEREIVEFVQAPDGQFETRRRTIKIVVDPTKGEPNADPLAGVIY